MLNLTIAELNEVLYCLRQTLSSKPELLRTDIAQSALTKVYNEIEHFNALINIDEMDQIMNDEAADENVNDLYYYSIPYGLRRTIFKTLNIPSYSSEIDESKEYPFTKFISKNINVNHLFFMN